MVADNLRPATITPILRENVNREARLITDEAGHYLHVGREFGLHGVARHGREEYVNPENRTIHTNTIEGYFSVFKRGMKGVYQHCAKKHRPLRLAEFDFRYNEREANGADDRARTDSALACIIGKRLTYRRTHTQA